ncbi:MAG TPA: DUF4893 domain-containing protein [Rhizorhapis sp.]
MMIRPIAAPLALMMMLAACTTTTSSQGSVAPTAELVPPDPIADWRNVISAADKMRLEGLEAAWTDALAEARKAGYTKAVKAEGALLEPDAALPRAAPPPGPYQCRVIKLGHPQGKKSGLDYIAYKGFACHVEAEEGRLWIVKQTGSQRPSGRIWPERDDRQIFLGAMELGDEKEPPAYGDDPDRDLAGYVERVGAFQWRIVIPDPGKESRLDVFELVPITPLARRAQRVSG